MVRNGCYGRQAISLDLGPTPRPPASPVALFLHAWTRGTGIRREGRVASPAPDVRGHRRDQKNSFEIHEVVAIERERTVRFDRPNIYLHLNEIIARLLDL